MNTNDVHINADIEVLLGLRDLGYKSTFVLAWEDVQALIERDPASITAVLSTLCLVEQLGQFFEPLSKSRTWNNRAGENKFKAFLFQLSSLSEDEVNALYALRCSLAHDFSVVNINNVSVDRKDYAYIFRLNFDASKPVIELPAEDWKGEYGIFTAERADEKNNFLTRIGATSLINLVRDIIRKLQKMHTDGELVCILGDDLHLKIMARYAMLFRKTKK